MAVVELMADESVRFDELAIEDRGDMTTGFDVGSRTKTAVSSDGQIQRVIVIFYSRDDDAKESAEQLIDDAESRGLFG